MLIFLLKRVAAVLTRPTKESRMNNHDIRWQQRFASFNKALLQLQNAVELSKQRGLTQLEKQGVIQAFEFTHELAWNMLKDYLQDQGNQNIKGSKDTTREAFKVELITDGEQWMAMIQSRNLSSHTYDERTAEQLVDAIIQQYYPLFIALQTEMKKYQS
jgi:nucleotidyltransferase substrate binding protein (TIGR01987 family)